MPGLVRAGKGPRVQTALSRPGSRPCSRARPMANSAASQRKLLAVGEVLWDALPAGLFMGGAPLNVACHLKQLSPNVYFASRVGNDELGREIERRFPRRDISTDLLQVDNELPTGFVIVTLDEKGRPSYEIKKPSAWDNIQPTDELVRVAEGSILVYGSLAQRELSSKSTILRLKDLAERCVFDVNLRPPDAYKEVVEQAADGVWMLKVSDEEMPQMREWFGLPEGQPEEVAKALQEKLNVKNVVLTYGDKGAGLLTESGKWHFAPGFSVQVVDTVGAGDAFLATVLLELLSDTQPEEALSRANAVAAWVTKQAGATPTYSQDAVLREMRAS